MRRIFVQSVKRSSELIIGQGKKPTDAFLAALIQVQAQGLDQHRVCQLLCHQTAARLRESKFLHQPLQIPAYRCSIGFAAKVDYRWLGIACLTAYESLAIATDLGQHKGKWIYVAGAGGGLGHFAAQIAKLNGLKVIGSASKPASLQLLRQLGLEAVVDYSKQDVVAEVLRITGGKGAEVVHDSTYRQASYMRSTAVVAAGGEYIRLASDIQMKRFGLVDLTKVVEERGARMTIADLGRYNTDPQFMPRWPLVAQGLHRAVEWCEAGMLKPIVTRVIPLTLWPCKRPSGTSPVGRST